jgi:glycosyltransferase involved in cell wall biosynthesis
MTPEQKNEMREKAWQTVKMMNEKVMARKYEKLYYKTVYGKDLVSVIIPTFNRADTITQVLDAYKKQTYEPIEIIVCDDNSTDDTKDVVYAYAEKNRDMAIIYCKTQCDGYGLAEARNRGIFEAAGHYLMFNDDRFMPKPEAVRLLVNTVSGKKEKNVAFGYKGYDKNVFIENFFAVRKADIVNAGMFNERGVEYGFQSQELRDRLNVQGFKFQYQPEAKAEAIFGTHNRKNKRMEILHSKTLLWLLRS